MAAGGQGAPLVPWTDWVLFKSESVGRVVLNIGGIANVTWLPPGAAAPDVIAFDTGPGNLIIDALVAHKQVAYAQYNCFHMTPFRAG